MTILSCLHTVWHKYDGPTLSYTLGLILLFFVGFYAPAVYFLMPAVLLGAFIPIAYDAYLDLTQRTLSTEVFLVVATGIALWAGELESITVVLLIMLIAKYFEHMIEARTDSAIESLLKLVPQDVIIKNGQQEYQAPLAAVTQGMHLVIKTGAQIPVDGVIIDGSASINESFLTGESIPREKTVHDRVYAGTFVESGSVVVEVGLVGKDTYFGKITKLIEAAEQEKAKIVSISNKAALIIMYVLIVFIAAMWIWTQDFKLVATLLVFGSPIELTLITPLAVIAGTAAAFRKGVLVKSGLALEKMAEIDTFIFDKTGTLTIGSPQVVDVAAAAGFTKHDVIKIAAILEKRSGHVIAKAILAAAEADNIVVPDPDDYHSESGHGITATSLGVQYALGSEHFISAPEHGNKKIPHEIIPHNNLAAATSFYIVAGDVVCGRVSVADTLRPEAQTVIQNLSRFGVKNIVLLSGDQESVVAHIAHQIGIKTYFAQVAPDEKLAVIKQYQKNGHTVAMVGDGINDAPALKQADVGIAMGGMGMEPAIEAAGIVLMANNLYGIAFIKALSRKIMAVILQNIFLGFAFIHLLGIILALMNLVSPIQAALFHAVSDLLMLINSARLIKFSLK